MSKLEQLKQLRKKMQVADLPLKNQATQLVFGEGNPEAQIIFIGEGPGYWEDQKGRPFVGAAGALLDRALNENSLRRKDMFITNVVHYRPPGNRDPEPAELLAFEPFLDNIIKIIDPLIIVTLGRFSMAKFIKDVKISQVHGTSYIYEINQTHITIIPMYHPAAALRNGDVLKQFLSDFAKLPIELKKIKQK